MEFIIIWAVFAGLVAVLASSYGRSGAAWFLLAVLISPVIAGIILLLMGKVAPAPAGDEPTPMTHVRCPDCRELVRMDARKCKHCGAVLVPQ